MGRARGTVAAINLSTMDAALGGVRRGTGNGNLTSANPTTADRAELQRILRPMESNVTDEAYRLLREHFRSMDRMPLIAELHAAVCKRLVQSGKRKFIPASAITLRSLGFDPQLTDGQLLDSEELQAKLDAELEEQARERTINLMKVDMPISEDVVSEEAYRKAFAKFAGAQCFQQREQVCKRVLGTAVPPNLREVSAWRAALTDMLGRYETLIPDETGEVHMPADAVLRATKPQIKRREAAPRRRQRYLH